MHRTYLDGYDSSNDSSEPEIFNKENASQVAIQSAKIVNAYGTYIQIFGIALGVITIIGGLALANSGGSATYGWLGLIIGLLEIAIFAVQGALFRMLSNYVIARLEQG
jgi:hypothetical protein